MFATECRYRLELATRILSAISMNCPVEPADENKLRAFIEIDDERLLPLPEIACRVIWRETRRSQALNTCNDIRAVA
jgi:hypothetical protein